MTARHGAGVTRHGSDVTTEGLAGVRPGREATTGTNLDRGRRRRGGRGERAMVPDAQFTSYYGKPVINAPVWAAPDIAGYLYLGGLAGASSLLAAGAQLTGRGELARVTKVGALAAIGLGTVGLVHDLGVPARFHHMLRVFKPTSPMNVGSWLLSAYGPAAGVAAVCELTGILPPVGAAATAGAALVGPAVAAYTAVLIADTAVPAWHDGYREMPFVFVGSAASAAGGLGLLGAPLGQSAPARRLAVAGAALELAASQRMERRLGMVAEPYSHGKGGVLMKAAAGLTVAGVAGSLAGRRSRVLTALSGAALMTASALTRFGIFAAGQESANDPKYTVTPQRERVRAGELARSTS